MRGSGWPALAIPPRRHPLLEVLQTIERLNANPEVDGILLQLPFRQAWMRAAADGDDPEDADGLHPQSRTLARRTGPAQPPGWVMAMLRSNGIDPAGKRAVVIGRSILVGQPMALMLQAPCHRHHRPFPHADLAAHPEADILVVAAGRPEFIGAERAARRRRGGCRHSPQAGRRMCGDVLRGNRVGCRCAFAVPGGVGPMTTMLLVNTVVAWCRRHNLDHDLDDLYA